MEKECKHCHQLLPISNFYKWKNKIHPYCKDCESTRRKTSLYKYKMKCLEYMKSDCCSICGYNKCLSALDFHHKDPNEKEFLISSSKRRTLSKEVKLELDKCIVVCANCHRELHTDKIFNEFKANVNTNQKYFCIDCKKQCGYKCDRCLKCHNKHKSRNQPTKSQLKKDIQNLKYFVRIGKKYGVSDNAVRKWARKYDLIE